MSGNVFEFGIGMLGVETGEYGGQHCVYISRNKVAGPVGELQPGQNGPVTLDAVPDDWLIFQFPSRERTIEVYNALCGINESVPVAKLVEAPAQSGNVVGSNPPGDVTSILTKALLEARADILQLKNARGSEAEGSDADWVGYIDAALSGGK